MPWPLTPRHKGTVCGDDEYAPINLGTRPGRRCWTAVRVTDDPGLVIFILSGLGRAFLYLSIYPA